MNLDINNNLISNINDQQLEIINDNTFQTQKQAICIVACAGSGKTMTIINKITYMIKYLNCKPNEFVLTTFTKTFFSVSSRISSISLSSSKLMLDISAAACCKRRRVALRWMMPL